MSSALVWFRRDLRHYDHSALAAALAGHAQVHCAFVFDREILDALGTRADRRVTFIWDSVAELREALESLGGGLHVLHGEARSEIPALARKLRVGAVYANRDYEPDAVARDQAVAAQLRDHGIHWRDCKDQVIFELDEVLTRGGEPFSVFTPYRRAWLARLAAPYIAPKSAGPSPGRLAAANRAMPALESLGFARQELVLAAGMSGGARAWTAFQAARWRPMQNDRDFPALDRARRVSPCTCASGRSRSASSCATRRRCRAGTRPPGCPS